MILDRESHPKARKLRRIIDACLSLLIVAACVLILWFVQIKGEPANKEKALLASCASQQSCLYKMMQVYDIEPQPGWTVADWFQAAQKAKHGSASPLPEEEFFCTKNRQPYLIFPVPASVLFTAPDPPVPVLMCSPGAHGGYGTNILYSDGTIVPVSREEAEKLVSEYSPEQIGIKSPEDKQESDPDLEETKQQAALNRLGAE